MNYSKRTTKITVGGPPPRREVNGVPPDDDRYYAFASGPEDIVRISFANFAQLARKGADEAVNSPKFVCLGKEWILTIYPGGISKAVGDVPPPEIEEDEKPLMAVILTLCDPTDEVKVISDVSLLNNDGDHYYGGAPRERTFGGEQSNSIGDNDYIGPEVVLDPRICLLKDGAMTFEVCMKPDVEGYGLGYEPFLPPNPFLRNLAKMFPFMDSESSDVEFVVEDKSDPKTGKATFPAHRIVLEASGSSLFHMLGESEDDSAAVEINDVSPSIFAHLLCSVYGLSIPVAALKSQAKELIDAADKYGVVHLKLQAEAWYCKTTTIDMNNVMDNLHFAESKNLALLKEKVMSFFMDHGREVVSELKLDDLPASSQSFRDILMAVNMERGRGGGNAEDVKAMSVNSLRTKLHEEGLEVDGTREMLVAALENNDNEKKRKRDSDDE